MKKILVADRTLTFRAVDVDDDTPTGAQLAASAGFRPTDNASVLHMLANGELEDVRPGETVGLTEAEHRFIIVASDSSYRFTIEGVRFDWPAGIITGAVVRRLGNIASDHELYLQRAEVPDRLIRPHELVDLFRGGVESFVTRKQGWKLNVQGVLLEIPTSYIVVRDALTQAGFNPEQGWQIFLKVAGQPKQAMALTDAVNLTTPGIEKLRLTPKAVNNGEALLAPRRTFSLLEVDARHLDGQGFFWETFVDAGRRWLLIHDYAVPAAYTVTRTQVAIEIPTEYPGAELDMFHVNPPLTLKSGRAIPATESDALILGVNFKRWSRHRGAGATWNPLFDNLTTHLALVESAIAAEGGE